MRIAVTYKDGKVFQHFGKTESFKIYEVEDGNIKSHKIVGTNGAGHGALAGFLAEQSVDMLICGGIGEGAREALAKAQIRFCSGADGEADQAVATYLRGELISRGVNCGHHHEEKNHCTDHA